LDLQTLPAGLYLLAVQTEHKTFWKKVIKKWRGLKTQNSYKYLFFVSLKLPRKMYNELCIFLPFLA
jgi:hypothetical protein